MKEGLSYFSIFLVTFLLIKVSAFHIYEEHDPIDDSGAHCELCLMAVNGLQLERIIPTPVAVPDSPIHHIDKTRAAHCAPGTCDPGRDYFPFFQASSSP